MVRKLALAVVIIAVFLALWFGIHIVRKHARERIAHIAVGTSQREVEAVLGTPRRLQRPCLSPRPKCEADMVYSIPFDFVGLWAISLDHSGHVIGKEFWESP